ncbi:MAG: EamA family transporter, partial [Actinomycetota bacterium]|nr:EamA family transporter [Actinomycetota bacterium]
MTRRSWALLGLLASLWGASYLFIKLGLEDLSPAMIVFARTALGALVLVPLALHRRALAALRGRWPTVLGLALLEVAGPFTLITVGERWIPSALAGILVASVPMFTAVLAIWIDQQERSHGWSVVGIAIGIVGVALLLGVDLGGEASTLLGGILVLLAGLGYALGGFVIKHRFPGAQPIGIAAATMVATAAVMLPFALATAPAEVPGLEASAAVLALGVGGTGIAFFLFYTLIAEVGPARASTVAYLAPGFAVVYGAVLLDEPITAATLAGLGLIVGGSWLAAEGRPPGRARAESSS